jgi:CubicO group peptidase (beta-lactamase class C family)
MIGAVPATWMSRPTWIARQNPTVFSNGDPDAMRRRSTGLVSPPVDALRQIESWECGHAAAAVVTRAAVATHGDTATTLRWASVTKLLSAYAGLLAAEEGILDLDEPAGPTGSTVRHLLAHTSGLPFEGAAPIGRPGERRIYSNTGIEVFADHLAFAAGMAFADYLRAGVLAPLGITGTLRGSPAESFHGPLDDLVRLARELLTPRLLAPETLAEGTSVQFPGLTGVLPGFGRQEPNDWGLGFELRDAKAPHWTGSRNSPRTYGHFGRSGTFLWVDPEREAALCVLTDREFGDWAATAWPALSDAVLAAL